MAEHASSVSRRAWGGRSSLTPYVPWAEYNRGRTAGRAAPAAAAAVGAGGALARAGGGELAARSIARPWAETQPEARDRKARLSQFELLLPLIPPGQHGDIISASPEQTSRMEPDRLRAELMAVLTEGEGCGPKALQSARTTLVLLTQYIVRVGDASADEPFASPVSGCSLNGFLREVHHTSVYKYAVGLKGEAPDDQDACGGTAAGGRLTSLRFLMGKCKFPLEAGATILTRWRNPFGGKREGKPATTPELAFIVQLCLVAGDPQQPPMARLAAAMAYGVAAFGLRTALAERSGELEERNGWIVGVTGADFKKRRGWRGGRPIVAPVDDVLGSTAWWGVLRGGFDGLEDVGSLILDFDSPDGDPFRASAVVGRPASNERWKRAVHAVGKASVRVGGVLRPAVCDAAHVESLTPHSLKHVLPTAFAAAGLADTLLPEACAHAGSRLERMSRAALEGEVDLNPRLVGGVATAGKYAAIGRQSSHAAIVGSVLGAVGSFVVSVGGPAGVPRAGGWHALTRYVVGQRDWAVPLPRPTSRAAIAGGAPVVATLVAAPSALPTPLPAAEAKPALAPLPVFTAPSLPKGQPTDAIADAMFRHP